jgi:hypothetical protein
MGICVLWWHSVDVIMSEKESWIRCCRFSCIDLGQIDSGGVPRIYFCRCVVVQSPLPMGNLCSQMASWRWYEGTKGIADQVLQVQLERPTADRFWWCTQNLFLHICSGAKPSADGEFVFSDGILRMVSCQKRNRRSNAAGSAAQISGG